MQKRPIRSVKDMRRGLKFGWLETVCATDMKVRSYAVWVCKCTRCGLLVLLDTDKLVHGDYVSCGCFRKEHNQNLRDHLHFIEGTCLEWIEKRKHRSDNTSGFRGVSFNRREQKWVASIGFQGKRHHLGYFPEYDDAVRARLDAEERMYAPFIQKHGQMA